MMTTTQKIRKQAEATLEAARAEYNEIEEKLETFSQQETEATEAMEAASDEMNLKAFNDARSRQFEAQSALKMYESRKNKLEVAPLISEEEYLSLCGSVMEDAEKRRDEMRIKLFDLARQIVELYDEYSGEIQECDDVLHLLQYDLYKANDMNRIASGQIVGTSKEVNRRQAFEYITWIGNPTRECYQAMMTAGIGVAHE